MVLQYANFYSEVVLLLLLQKEKKTIFPSAPAAVPWSSAVGSPTRWGMGTEFHVGGAAAATKLQTAFSFCFNVNIKSSILSKTEDLLIGNRREKMNHQVALHHPRLDYF